MFAEELPQKIHSMLPMGRRGVQVLQTASDEEVKSSARGSITENSCQEILDFSDSQDKLLYKAMYTNVEAFLQIQASVFNENAMNVAESHNIKERVVGGDYGFNNNVKSIQSSFEGKQEKELHLMREQGRVLSDSLRDSIAEARSALEKSNKQQDIIQQGKPID